MRYQSPARSSTSSCSPRATVVTMGLVVFASLRTFTLVASTCTESAQPLPAVRTTVRTIEAIRRNRVDMDVAPVIGRESTAPAA